ncbi:Membrane protein involved in the export of O-antigen and teichoic acid [Geoalkalibacter ferrihydriticus]|uniref:Uncharacterized protein n=2 Tax=Geoalkalibacter ferrihydriticus TaxID=392333 RepID=A0A0C2HRS4_9BACT|nr:oligosaccharide flippase family protein [Geoalkalibacter ferrihydriticus]KIH75472.1 hypothetical protein GFER_16050 [Geoalkalibacter ferrihydriticus DSM 17813]SDM84685.1 Membrane protein involved in the export of O-antigen and teichoic acid [Geoalkalibacter ferrihydriticus]
MLQYLKQTLRHSAVYSFANVVQKGVGFLMIPVYTHFLSPAEYGVLEMMDLTMMVLSMITGMKIGGAVIRFYFRYDSLEEKREVLSTGLIGITIFALSMALVLEALARPISGLLLGSVEYYRFFQIIFISMALQTVAVVPESLLLAQKRSVVFSTITLLTFVSYLSLNILFIVGMKMGVMGMVLSTVITKIFNVSMLFAVTRGEFSFSFSVEKFKAMLAYSLPLIPAGLCMFAIHYSDRFFIQKYVGLESLGIYSLGYKFGMIISILVTQPIFRIWNTQRYEIAKSADADIVFGRMFTYILFAFLGAGLVISTLIDEIIGIMAPAQYQGAAAVVALIVCGYILFGCASFTQLGMFINYKTKYVAYINFATALLNVVMNLVLISRFGIMGAAVSTMLTFFSLAFLSYLVSQKLLPVKYEYLRVVKLVTLSIALYALSRAIDLSLWPSLAAKIGLLSLYPGLLYVIGFFSVAEIAKGRELLHKFSLRRGRSAAKG